MIPSEQFEVKIQASREINLGWIASPSAMMTVTSLRKWKQRMELRNHLFGEGA